jgi:DMSO/TMAO reductase YedYZ molybdopterin-dependent catalytic subunit
MPAGIRTNEGDGVALDIVAYATVYFGYLQQAKMRPSQGFPMRVFVPGCEGNISIKWLMAIKLQAGPAFSREETSKYTDLLKDGQAQMFSLRMGVKSLITTLSGLMTLPRQGVVEISGLAWSGRVWSWEYSQGRRECRRRAQLGRGAAAV